MIAINQEPGSSARRDTTASPVRLVAAGDIMLGDSAICVGYGLRSRCYDGNALERRMAPLTQAFRDAEIAFGNLESTLSDLGSDAMSWRSSQMRGRPSYARALANIGFNVISVANNHAVQHGIACFHDTVAMLRENGIAVCGLAGSQPWCSDPVCVTSRHGVRVGVLGYCLRPRQFGSATPPFAEGNEASIIRDIEMLKPTVDYVVVSLHWGEEFVAQPSEAEVRGAHRLTDAGATLVIGHHPHVSRTVEIRDGAAIAYSLGNGISDMIWYEPATRGLALKATMDAGTLKAVETAELRVDRDYSVSLGTWCNARENDRTIAPLAERAYQVQVRRTVAAHRRAAYAYALRNLSRYRPRILSQLLMTTLRNKARSALRWAKHSPIGER